MPRVVIRLPDLAAVAESAILPPIQAVADGNLPAAQAVRAEPVFTPEASGDAAATQHPPAEQPKTRPPLALLVDHLARRSLQSLLAPLGTMANVYLILQRPKIWLAVASALAVQVVAALVFNGPAEPPSKAHRARSAGQLPAAAGSSARRSADAGPVEIVVPQPDDFDAPSSPALRAEQDQTAPPAGELTRQSPQAAGSELRLAIRPHVWPSLKPSGAKAFEPGVATLEGIEPLEGSAIDTAWQARSTTRPARRIEPLEGSAIDTALTGRQP